MPSRANPNLKNIIFGQYATYNEQTKNSTCVLCAKSLKGNRISNIIRHYQLIHKKNLKDIGENGENNENTENLAITKKQTFTLKMDKRIFFKCCVGLVTVKNIPFRIFDDQEFFKKLIAPYEEKFNVCINSKNIGVLLEKTTEKVKTIIRERVRNRMISLKLDIATRMERSILGINIQYIKSDKICINTIGMIQINQRHTGQFLKNEVLRCLETFGIDIKQIYSTTSDNGSNAIKTSKCLQELQEESLQDSNDDESEIFDEEVADQNEIIQSKLESILSIVRCASHTLQLAAYDVIKTIEPEITECRNIVKKIRTSVRSGDAQVKMPTLDSATRWNFTFYMINSLLDLRSYITENLEDISVNWDFVQDFAESFKFLAECTLKLQKEQYVIGDFYRDWLSCELELLEISEFNTYARCLYNAMNTRKAKLFDNKAFVAALYLDPRFNFESSVLLTETQKITAVSHLMATYDLMLKLKPETNTDMAIHEENSSSDSSNNDVSILQTTRNSPNNRYLKLRQHIQSNMTSQQTGSSTRTLKQKLILLCEGKMQELDINPISFWNKFKNTDKDLYCLAKTVLAVPASQVSVERAFSALSTILTKLRTKLTKKNLSNILLSKLNFDILDINHFDTNISANNANIDLI